MNYNCTKRTLWFWILDFIFAFEWAEKMFAVNQQGKDSYLGNTQVFCRETNHKKEPGIFQLQIWAEGIFLYLSWKSGQKKRPRKFQPQSWADPPPHFDEPCTLSLSTQGGSRTPPKVKDGEYQLYGNAEYVGRGKEDSFLPALSWTFRAQLTCWKKTKKIFVKLNPEN